MDNATASNRDLSQLHPANVQIQSQYTDFRIAGWYSNENTLYQKLDQTISS